MLYDHLKLPVQYTERKKKDGAVVVTPSADKFALMMLKDVHPVVEWVQKYRKDKKIYEYLETISANLDIHGRLHTNFNQFKENTASLRTGRLSSSDPINFENIPNSNDSEKVVRRCFIPDTEFFFADFQNQEGRLYAYYANEKGLKNAFITGEDVHSRTASYAFPEYSYEQFLVLKGKDKIVKAYRDIGKRAFFRKLYGGGYKKGAVVLAEYGFPYDIERMKEIDYNILKGLPNFRKWTQRVQDVCRERGYIYDILGRHYMPKAPDKLYAMPNYLIQGTAGGMLKTSIVRIWEATGRNDIFSNYIHDETVFDRLPDRKITKTIVECMEDWPQISVPMLVEASYAPATWAEKLEIKDLNEWITT